MRSMRFQDYFLSLCIGVMLGGGCERPIQKPTQKDAGKIERFRLRDTFGKELSPVASLAFDPAGKTLTTGHKDGTIRLWDVATREVINTLRGHADVVTSVAFLSDGKTLASGSLDGTIKLWDVASGKANATLEDHGSGVTSVSLNPKGIMLASGSLDRTIKLWNLATGKVIKTLEGHTDVVTSVAFRPDGKTLASGSLDRTIKLWDVASGKANATLGWDEKQPFVPNFQGVACLAFSPDGKTLAAGAEHSWIFHWDVDSGKIVGWTSAQYMRVNTVAFSPNGKTLASCCMDDTDSIKLWDMGDVGKRKIGLGGIPSLECLWQEPMDGFSQASAVAFSPDGETLATGQGLGVGKIKFWDVLP